MKSYFFVAFNIIINHIFPENFIVIPQVVRGYEDFLLQYQLFSSIFLGF